MKYAYYPGCSLKASSREFDTSLVECFKTLGIELVEIESWCCCGSTPAHMVNKLLSIVLPIKNLLWAEERGLDVVSPCAACFSALKTADFKVKKDPEIRRKVNTILEKEYKGTSRILHSVDLLARDIGLARLTKEVKVPLTGLKAAAFYGCLLTRPPKVKDFDDPEDPKLLDNLVQALGAETVKWTHKTVCCGASFSATEPKHALKLCSEIFAQARKADASCLVVACPLCHTNLDLNQEDVEKHFHRTIDMPVFYFSQLLGIALGLPPAAVALDKNIVEPWNVLSPYLEVDAMEYR